MLNIKQNSSFDPLILNFLKVCDAKIVKGNNFALYQNGSVKHNPTITFKVLLFISGMIKDDKIIDNTITISSKDIKNMFHISAIKDFVSSLEYIKSLNYTYEKESYLKNSKNESKCIMIITSITQYKGFLMVKVSKDFVDLVKQGNSFYTIPDNILAYDNRYKYVGIIATYILLEKARNHLSERKLMAFEKKKAKGLIQADAELKERQNISIRKFIEYTNLPTYDKLDNSKHIYRQLIAPLDRNIKLACSLLGYNVKYVGFEDTPTCYSDFVNAYVKVTSQDKV